MNSSRIILWSTVKLSLELENRSECQTKRKTFLNAVGGRRNESRVRAQGCYIKKGLTERKSCSEHVDNVASHALLFGSTW